jgi:hypothetical protein
MRGVAPKHGTFSLISRRALSLMRRAWVDAGLVAGANAEEALKRATRQRAVSFMVTAYLFSDLF